jgi:hypothetical protein
MGDYIVNQNTSLIALNTKSLRGGSTILVYLSSTPNIGQIVTIRDVDGFISSPQAIQISTTNCSLTDHVSSIFLRQRFAYLTLQSVSSNVWSIINESPFHNPSANYNVRGIESVNTNILSNVSLNSYVSTGNIYSGTTQIQSSMIINDAFFTDTLVVGDDYTITQNSSITVRNSMYNSEGAVIRGVLSTHGQLSLFSSMIVNDSASISGSLIVQGGFKQSSVAGYMSINTLSTGYGFFVLNELSTGGHFQLFSGASITRNLTVSSLFTKSTLTNRITISTLQLSTNSSHNSRTDITVSDPTYLGISSPVLEIQNGLAATSTIADWVTINKLYTASIEITGIISSPNLSQLILSTANIINPNGSLLISSIGTNNINISTLYGAGFSTQLKQITSDSTRTSTLTIQYECITSGILEAPYTNVNSVSINSALTSSLTLENTTLTLNTLTLSSIFISSSLNASGLSSIQIFDADILNGSGIFQTSITTASNVSTHTIQNVSQINSGNSIHISTSLVRFSTANTSSLGAYILNTSSIVGVGIQFGTASLFSTLTPDGLYLRPSTLSGLTSNTFYEYISGLGTVYSPIKIKAISDRSVYMSLGNISSFSTSYLNVSMNYRNDSATLINGSAGFQIHNGLTYSTLIYFNASPFQGVQTASIYNYPIFQDSTLTQTTYFIDGVVTQPLTSTSEYNLVAGGLGGNQLAYSQDSGITWNAFSVSPISTEVLAVNWGSTKWLAGGTGTNTLAYSYNGIVWYGLGASLFTNTRAILWNGYVWVAGGTGTNTLAYSYDGFVWIGIGSVTFTNSVNSISWNGYIWVAVGAGTNTIAYSYNGITWSGIGTSIFSTSGVSVVWGSTLWLAVGSGGNQSAYSYNGISWTPGASIFTGTAKCLGWNGIQWLAGGQGTYTIAISSNGINWTPVTSPITTVNSLVWSDRYWVVGGNTFAYSPNGINWTISSSTPLTTCFTVAIRGAIASQNNFLLTTSDTRTLTYSLGGSTWRAVSSLISGRASSILWNGDLWLAGMLSGSDTIIYSSDGINWIGLGKILFATKCIDIAWNGYIWVAVGDAGVNTIAYSYDGRAWTGVGTSVFSTSGNGVAWGNGIGFIVTGSGTNTFAQSNDGINWTPITTNIFTAGGKLAYNGSIWVACGSGPNGTLAYSTSGTNWIAPITQPFSIAANDVKWNGSNLWVAVGTSSNGNTLAYSPNGINWTPLALSYISGKGITWTGDMWFTTGATSSNFIAYVSSDGINWSPSSSTVGGAYTIASKTANPNVLLIACGSGPSSLAISADGFLWKAINNPLTTAICTFWNGSLWVAGGDSPYSFVLAYSSNGLNWTGVNLPNMTRVYSISYFTNSSEVAKWIAVGEGTHTRAESVNGITWTSYPPATGGFFTSGAYGILGGNGWTSVGSGYGGILSTTDGTNWTSPASLFTTGYGIAANGKQTIAVGNGTNTIAVTYNGSNWIGLGTIVFTTGYGIAYGGNTWVAVGVGINSIAYSTDGLTWMGLGTTVFTEGKAVLWNGQQFIAFGTGLSTIATSPDGVVWNGQGNSIFTVGLGIGVKSTSPPRYSVREPRTANYQSAGNAGAVGQTTLVKFSGGDAWDSRVNSAEGFIANAYLKFAPTSTTGWFIMGLAETPTATTSFSQITYGISCNNGAIAIYQSGFFVQSYGSYVVGDTFTINFTGSTVDFYKNLILLKSVSRVPGNPLYMSCSLYSTGVAVKDVEFHKMYKYTRSYVEPSTTGFIASVVPSANISLAPIYLNLTSDLSTERWDISLTAGGTIANVSSSLYADVYFNSTYLISTNVLKNLYLTSPSTYTLSFSSPSKIAVVAGDTLSVRIRGSRTYGDSYIYTNYLGITQSYSSFIQTLQPNINSVEYLEFFHNTSSTGLQTSEMTAWISPVSTNTTSYIDSNYGIVMNRSYIRWNSALNGITIENPYNDTSTRSLTYTGALYHASDSNLKHSVEYVNPELYMTAINTLPLRRYRFNDSYINTFQSGDRWQLGVLTSEVEPIFSSMVKTVPFTHCGIDTIDTVDRTQLRYAHLAATQGLIHRVSTLKGKVLTASAYYLN